MRKLLFLLLLVPVFGFAQKFASKDFYLVDSLVLDELSENDKHLLDSCLKVYHDAKQDTNKVKAINTFMLNCYSDVIVKYNYWQLNFVKNKLKDTSDYNTKTISFYKEAYSISLSDVGYYYAQMGKDKEAINFYKKSIKISKEIGDNYGIAIAFNNIGSIFEKRGEITEALSYYYKALKLMEEENEEGGAATLQNNIGLVFFKQGKLDKALTYFNKSMVLYEKVNDMDGVATSYSSIGNVYGEKQLIDSAIFYFQKGLEINREMRDIRSEATALNNIAVYYEAKEDYELSLKYHFESIELYKQVGDKDGVAKALKNIGKTYFNSGNIKEAKKYALQSMEVAESIKYPDAVSRAARLLYKVYKAENNGLEALKMYELYVTINDSLNDLGFHKSLINNELKYEYEKQKAIDAIENEKLVEIEKNEKEKQQIYTYSGIAGVFLMLLVSGLIFRGYRQKKQANILIGEQKREAETQRDIATTQKLIVEEKNKEILESITYAKRIQEAILPPPRLVKEWLTESFIFYKPKDIVAGDFYWMETATHKIEGKEKMLVYFAAADCTGHGVPGAMVSVVCANALNKALKEFNLIEPGHVLDKVTELVLEAFEKSEEDIKDGMDIALCAMDISAKKIYYSGANNPLYRITSIKTKVEPSTNAYANETHQLMEYKATKQPVGFYENAKQFDTIEIQLEPGDAIYVFSDGFADQFGGAKGKKYKYSSFRQCLLENFYHPMETQKQLLETEFENWKGELEQVDDVCVIGVKINGVEKNNFTQRELEVLKNLQEGLPSKLIADKMNISKHTVDTYRRRLLAKTGTYNATELINYCIKKEII